ncbi:MAG: glycosyltransferase [Elusimicrobiota bacterium]
MENNKLNATLIILTFNEIDGLKKIFNKLPINKIDDIFSIDGGSTDGTIDFLVRNNIVTYVQDKPGRAEAFRIGVKKAKYDNIVFFSPDGNENPDDIVNIIKHLENGFDMVIASRFLKGSRNEEDNKKLPFRIWANKIFTGFANVIWNKYDYITDTINGFRGIKKPVFIELNPDGHGYVIEYQLSIRAMKLKKKIKEFPTIEGDRLGGTSKSKSIPTGLLFLRYLIKEILIGTNFN